MIHRIVRAHLWIAAVLAAIVTSTGLVWSTRVAAGADAYGYVSQADLAEHGHHPYFVLEPQEIADLRARYGPRHASARLDWTPMVSFRGGAVTMYDGVRRERAGTPVSLPPRTIRECLPQRPAPTLRQKD